MRASNSPWVHRGVLLGLLSIPLLSGCNKEIKADFPRPPATAAIVPPASQDPPEEPKPVSDEPPAPKKTGADESSTSPEPAPTAPRPRPKPRPEAPVEPSPPSSSSPEPPSTQLVQSEKTDLDPELAKKLERASLLLGSISDRSLTPALTDQLTAARAFVAQARQALADGDERRALVLIDKGLILAEDVERLSRP